MITVIAYHPLGFEIRVDQEDPAKIEATVSWLLNHDYRARVGYDLTPEGLPICPRHRVPLTKREKQGDIWFSHNVGSADDPIWCRGYQSKTSPGWDIANGNGAAPTELPGTPEETVNNLLS